MAHGRKPRNQQRPKHAARRVAAWPDPARVRCGAPRRGAAARDVPVHGYRARGHPRVSKEAEGPGKGPCTGCGRGMKSRDVACRRCGQPRMAMAGKAAAPAFIGKAAGGGVVVPLMAKSARPSTWPCPGCGHQLGKNATSCRRCGRPGGPGALKSAGQAARFVAKSAAGAVGPSCPACFRPQPPGTRYSTCHGHLLPGANPLVAKSADSPWEREFWNEHDPGRRELLRRLMEGNGGAAS